MFILSEMKDVVHVKPWYFENDLYTVIEDELNKKFANKVINQLGLCIALFDIKKIVDSLILPGDGSSHTKVFFRYVIFRPLIDEIIVGRIKNSNIEGINVSLSFFDDIFIPSSNLQKPYRFDEQEQLFVWQYETDDRVHELYFDIGEEIRFRVVKEFFLDTNPSGPPVINDSNILNNGHNDGNKCPYTIIGSVNEPGLGLLSWWKN